LDEKEIVVKYWLKTGLMAALAAALVGIYFLDDTMSEKKKESERIETRALNFVAANVRSVKLARDTSVFVFERTNASAEWTMKEPARAVRADQDAVNTLLTVTEGMTSSLEISATEKVLTGADAEKAQFGLDKPRYRFEITLDDKSAKTLQIGGDMEIGSRSAGKFAAQAVYASNSERNSVFVLSTSHLSTFKKTFGDFRTKMASNFNTPDVKSFVVSRPGSSAISVVQGEKGWAITAPREISADQNAVTALLNTLSTLKVDKVTEKEMLEPQRMSAFGLDAPAANVELFGDKQKSIAKWAFGAVKNAYFVTMVDGAVGSINAEKLKECAPDLNILRDKRILPDVAIADVARIRTASGKVFVREGASWYAAENTPKAVLGDSGKNDSKSGVSPTSTPAGKTVVSEAADLFAEWEFMAAKEVVEGNESRGLPAYGLAKPAQRFAFQTADSKLLEEILVGNRVPNNQKLVYVKRTSRAPIYVVDAGWLDKLTKLDGVKFEPSK
jgi:hypothetical protein